MGSHARAQAGCTFLELVLVLVIGTGVMHFIEDNWGLRTSLYWAVETSTTVRARRARAWRSSDFYLPCVTPSKTDNRTCTFSWTAGT